jgi:hypothetical protein
MSYLSLAESLAHTFHILTFISLIHELASKYQLGHAVKAVEETFHVAFFARVLSLFFPQGAVWVFMAALAIHGATRHMDVLSVLSVTVSACSTKRKSRSLLHSSRKTIILVFAAHSCVFQFVDSQSEPEVASAPTDVVATRFRMCMLGMRMFVYMGMM